MTMKHPRNALLAALVLAGTATAASATVVYREAYVEPAPVVRVETVASPRVMVYEDGYVTYNTYEPKYLERRYIAPRETVVVRDDPVYVNAPRYYDAYPSPHPQWGHLIDDGLFNRYGENDFGK
jgi:hypothetical protein